MLEELGEFHVVAPARLEHLLIGVSALNTGDGRMLEGGYAARATMTLTLVTNKGQRQKDYKFKHSISPNSQIMVRGAPVRLLRQLMLRGALLGCHARRPEAVARLVESPDFTGLTPEDAGFKDWYEMAHTCAELHWAKWQGAEEWALIPNVCVDTGVIQQRTSYPAAKLSKAVAEIGHDLGYPPSEWGWWSIRKKVCNDIVSAGDDEIAGRELGHANVDNRTKNRVYKKGLQDRDMGSYAIGAERLPLVDMGSLSARRVPGARVREFVSVRRDGAAYAKYFAGDERVSSTRPYVKQLEAEVACALGIEGDATSLRLTKVRLQALEQHNAEAHANAVELQAERAKLIQFIDTAEQATMQVERRHLWQEGQTTLGCDERERLAMQTVQKWPQMCEAHAVAFSLARPDLSRERKVMLSEELALRDVILGAGAPHLLTNRNWQQAFVAVCSTCEKETPPVRPLRCCTVGCEGGEWSYRTCVPDLDHVVSESGKCVWRDLFSVWRAMGGDEHTGYNS